MVAAGVRRIEALTGVQAITWLAEQDERLRETAALLKVSTVEVPERVAALVDERKKLEREVSELRRQRALGSGGSAAIDAPKTIGGVAVLSRILEDVPARDLKPLADQLRQNLTSGVIALVAAYDGKVSLVVSVSADLSGRLSAVDLVRAGAEAVGGKGGGGRADMAQAGGHDITAMPQAVAAIEACLG